MRTCYQLGLVRLTVTVSDCDLVLHADIKLFIGFTLIGFIGMTFCLQVTVTVDFFL